MIFIIEGQVIYQPFKVKGECIFFSGFLYEMLLRFFKYQTLIYQTNLYTNEGKS